MRQLPPPHGPDVETEKYLRGVAEAILELQRTLPTIIKGVSLVDAIPTYIPNPIGRTPQAVTLGIARGASSTGRVVETISNVDRTRAIVLTATGWGATITIDVLVWP